jgi:hypothetical protein
VEQGSTLAIPAFEPACPGSTAPPTQSPPPNSSDRSPSVHPEYA